MSLLIAIDRSDIREGKLSAVERAIGDLVEFVRQHEPRVIFYGVYLDDSRTRMTVLQVHPDSASMEYHMERAGTAFPQFAELLEMSSLEVYGEPSGELVARLGKKARMLGSAEPRVHELVAGMNRLP